MGCVQTVDRLVDKANLTETEGAITAICCGLLQAAMVDLLTKDIRWLNEWNENRTAPFFIFF